jgi:peroxiredoxin
MDPVIRAGQPAPDLALPDLGGKPYRLREAHGRILIIDFWSADCPWSERTEAEIAGLENEWGERAVVWRVASNANESHAAMQSALLRRPELILLWDAEQRAADALGALTTPHLFVIDRGGILRYQGAFDDVTFRQRTPTRGYLAEAVSALLRGGLPDPSETPAYGCAIVRRAAWR